MERTQERPDIAYKNDLSKAQLWESVKIAGQYVVIVALWFFLIHVYLSFGKWIGVSIGAMWVLGAFACWWLPEEREYLIKDTKYWIFYFLLFLGAYRFAMQHLVQITPEQVQASLDVPIPAASGETAIGLLETGLFILLFTVPLGFATWVVQHMKRLRVGMTKREKFRQLRGSHDERHRI